MPVHSKHPEYIAQAQVWEMCQDFVSGTRAVKHKKEKYLPRPNPNDKSNVANERYDNYLSRAVFYEFSKKCVNQYLGLAFKQDPICEIADELKYLKNNANGANLSIYQLAQKGFKALMTQGRFGLWVDYPETTDKDRKLPLGEFNKRIRPKVLFYDAFSIINWQMKKVGNDTVPVLIVLQEHTTTHSNDPFVQTPTVRYRVLGLDDVGYYVAIWEEQDKGEYTETKRHYPTDGKGNHWRFIPFAIFGSQNNSFDTQDIPIEPLVHIEKGVYCNSADAENSRFLCGQVQPFMNVDSNTAHYYQEKDKDGNAKNPLILGSETVIMLGENGSFGFASANANTMATEGINEKREIIAELGYQLGQAGGGIKTATQADNETQAQHSQASLCVANINEGFMNMLSWCYSYMALNEKPFKFAVRQNFSPVTVDIGVLSTLNQLVDGGKLPRAVIWNKAKEFNLLDAELNDDDIMGMIDADFETSNIARTLQGTFGE